MIQFYRFDKGDATNLTALLLTIGSYFSPFYQEQIQSIGLYALSGGVTNSIAIFMLFEKIPFLYGSGVIPNRFEHFKGGIKKLIMEEFFQRENILKFFESNAHELGHQIHIDEIINQVDPDILFNKLKEAIMSSSFQGMIQMMGGDQILDNLKGPFQEKFKEGMLEIARSEKVTHALSEQIHPEKMASKIESQIESIVNQKLEELTPQRVKEIIQKMIREHLGMLVVWGGIFGGLIGLIASFL